MTDIGSQLDRRSVVKGTAVVLLASASAARGDDGALARAAIAKIAQGKPLTKTRVKITLPELAENGNSVGLTVSVDSPMTPENYVRTIYIVSEKNPIADVVKFHLTPRAGRAWVATNIRLATTQTVTAIAEMNDGALFADAADVIVTLAACIEGG